MAPQLTACTSGCAERTSFNNSVRSSTSSPSLGAYA
eukprot:CAMPEP_0115758160 /NCGR_PEP_ID=MMETSP0272-20121206/98792_1 /TAXON_ID=71861 /ORGANISM="Scrippsiella trochoidea, Strain CCMP3099" /LENGTH=35 /DNA_ID= /DNA_START= /DNA_END= /DNA_ORIENTATION=